MAIADVEQDGLHPLRLHRLAVGELHLEAVPVEGDRGVDVLDGDSDMVDAAEHGSSVYAAALSCSFWSQYGRKEQLTRRLDAEDLLQGRDGDLELLGRGLL